jgi:hypothetical protein
MFVFKKRIEKLNAEILKNNLKYFNNYFSLESNIDFFMKDGGYKKNYFLHT